MILLRTSPPVGGQGPRRGRRLPPRGASVAVAVAVAAALVASGCGSSSSAGGGRTALTLYNAQHEQTTDALVAAFTKQTGIKVKVDNNGEDVLTAQIEQEGSRSPADVFYTENSNWLAQLDQRGMLAKVDATTLANVPSADNAADGDWVGVSARVSAMVYNPGKLRPSQLPQSVMDLAQPQWKGKIEIAPAETDFWPIVSSVARTYGTATTLSWLKGLKANAGSGDDVPDSETLASDVSQGTTELALINHYYFYRLQAEVGKDSVHAAIASFKPHDPGYVEDISGAAVLKSSTHQAAAQELLAFLTSGGQTVLAAGDSYEYPLHPGVAPHPPLTSLSQLQPADFTPAELGTGVDAKTLLQQAGLL